MGRQEGSLQMLAVVHQPLKHDPALAVIASLLGDVDALAKKALADSGVLSLRLGREAEVWLGADLRTFPAQSPTSAKVLIVMEPPEVGRLCTDGFDLVLTWQEEHLASLTNARLFLPAMPWLLPGEWSEEVQGKPFGLGFLRGFKEVTEGHRLRHGVWHLQHRLRELVPLEFIVGANAETGRLSRAERNRQFSRMFVLVVENCRRANYFTEKLLDALLSSCVPVYWGCPNVNQFFDTTGIIVVDGDAEAVVEACLRLTEEDYHKRAEAIKRNFNLAARFADDFSERVQRVIEDAFNAS